MKNHIHVANLYLFPNGNIAAFDVAGNQISRLQKRTGIKGFIYALKYCNGKTEIYARYNNKVKAK